MRDGSYRPCVARSRPSRLHHPPGTSFETRPKSGWPTFWLKQALTLSTAGILSLFPVLERGVLTRSGHHGDWHEHAVGQGATERAFKKSPEPLCRNLAGTGTQNLLGLRGPSAGRQEAQKGHSLGREVEDLGSGGVPASMDSFWGAPMSTTILIRATRPGPPRAVQ